MHIKILGFNLFQKGGTSRSNLNLLRALKAANHTVTYINYVPFRKRHVEHLKKTAVREIEGVNFESFHNVKSLTACDVLILTREDFFKYAREVKRQAPTIQILGELHAPLAYINPSFDLALEAIDAVRVSTPDIAKAFASRFEYPYVFPMYVNTDHIVFQPQPSPNTKALMMKARFEDAIKDISYALKLMHFIVYTKGHHDVEFHIQGYGPSLELYEQLITYYQLERQVFLNGDIPKHAIYISTSPYETLGYSILEAIGDGNQACIYPGDDAVLTSIYQPFHAVHFLNKQLEHDYQVIMATIQETYTDTMRNEDFHYFNQQFQYEDYSDTLLRQLAEKADQHVITPHLIEKTRVELPFYYSRYVVKHTVKKALNRLPNSFKRVLNKKSRLYQYMRRGIFAVEKQVKQRRQQRIHPSRSHVFIESFHGKNFSGDPKAIALEIQRQYPDKVIYVSAANEYVDIEIRQFDMQPVRFGSREYIQAFERAQFAVINGNLWDRLLKHPKQTVIQTWHGMPLKRMVNDLMDPVERQQQSEAFLPRMLKWDVLLSCSERYEALISSAFNLSQHPSLNIWREGAPRNSMLIRHQEDEHKRHDIQEKYVGIATPEKRYILFCPTWRKSQRQNVSELDLKTLVHLLPDNYEVIVKLHPNEGHLYTTYRNMDSRIHCFMNEWVDIQELYLICDALITDYSSALFDYAHLNRPIIVLDEDTQDYHQTVGFYFELDEMVSVKQCTANAEVIADYILKHKSVDHSAIIRKFMVLDHEASDKNIVNHMFSDK
ncbi:CDP-glycerol glycerophosphotransferase family protein [Staphylococcus agnetis]|uniref:CDP-glycerol--glycerophosphate glycerophosphotransferase n=2 Tax=Staphylococcus agnetis TaxID=985762 RepID=A0ABX3Z1N7_9STAP|nr:CDP-glycerol glycerophosphotransferase family protein [Staphylococcus agnetis]OSP22260.1 CDP-glycerol--glycerophosphate glycerophosphotransferase [Staphylococcus agnetis]OSP24084.1 CDP-glycerol--glycerophosphate glycerophosphotransferase [Staphylococcus agnetis]OTW30825.1 CDP-glycerol--glycerophosphate glycerophosphotransferase [Staphylococcus agnetis]UXU59239.1 CDP-glycerol glycerophosphotransferase family protein [Staphylococcus agnetis]UXU61565.1 CDP-glycerol glycerophosphotransferase fa